LSSQKVELPTPIQLMKRPLHLLFLLLSALGAVAAPAAAKPLKDAPTSAYLFAYFIGNDIKEEAIRFALSTDGYHYRALNGNQPIISSATISETGGVRDPHILRGADGKTFYMVATDMVSAKGWSSNRGMVLSSTRPTLPAPKPAAPPLIPTPTCGASTTVCSTKQEYLPTAMKGWQYLTTIAVQPDGTVGYVQLIGEKAIPGQVVDKSSTANFGVGAFLLAANEMYYFTARN
jgi:hypothetical protein